MAQSAFWLAKKQSASRKFSYKTLVTGLAIGFAGGFASGLTLLPGKARADLFHTGISSFSFFPAEMMMLAPRALDNTKTERVYKSMPASPQQAYNNYHMPIPRSVMPDLLEKPVLVPVNDKERKITALKVYLDRNGLSPGAIDGKISPHLHRLGEHLIRRTEFSDVAMLPENARLEALATLVFKQMEKKGQTAFKTIELNKKDISGPFVSHIPARIQDQAGLKKLAYRSPLEALAEAYHMDEAFLRRLNPHADFSKPGTQIRVANIGDPVRKKIARIRADKHLGQAEVFDKAGQLVALYPISIGSDKNPSPSGDFIVRNKAVFPSYTLQADNSFEPTDDNKPRKIAPGPTNPVGTAWIGISARGYGLHGTPEPSKIGQTASHGCVRLTNWDAMELVYMARRGVKVEIK